MSDAKSRYEIVDELTNKKVAILDQIAQAKGGLIATRKRIEQQKRNDQRQAEDMEANFEVDGKAVEEALIHLQNKVDALDESVEAIKAISSNNEKAKGGK